MLVPLSWLQEFAPIEGDPAHLGEVLTDLGMVVEDITTSGANWDGIIVAKVLRLAPHPNADKIQLVGVDIGNGESLQICAGVQHERRRPRAAGHRRHHDARWHADCGS
ncbi:MAG: hypothetical protein R2706_12565 [Acidimicrobiales bacterium]